MHIPRDPGFDEERERFALRHCCEHCDKFDLIRAACRHEFPTGGHRLEDYLDRQQDLLFCKEFELC
jgi:hypothetical protein